MRTLPTWIGVTGLVLLLLSPQGAVGQGRGSRGRGGGFDPGRMFDLLAKGRPAIPAAELSGNPWTARLAQYAQEKGLSEVTRDNYTAYLDWRKTQGTGPGTGGGTAPGGLPPGPASDPPVAQRKAAERDFRLLDQNRDGYLVPDEVPADLHDELFQYDHDGDGRLSLEEFLHYEQDRAKEAPKAGREGEPFDVNGLPRPEPQQRAALYRAGKLPKELPPWFRQLDTDGDGQVSLYEWRLGRKPLPEFLAMDRNDDGFLTAEEVLRYQRLAQGKAAGSGTQTASAAPVSQPGGRAGFPGSGFRGPGRGPGGPGFPGRGGGRRGRKGDSTSK